LSACESFGIPLVEAQSAGVIPIIAAGTAQEEIAGDGALVFDESSGSLQAIADTMRDTDTQIRLVSLAKENAKRFDWSAIYHNAESPFA
jgi:glycosyltransferase involved in cell wall biosynthesis